MIDYRSFPIEYSMSKETSKALRDLIATAINDEHPLKDNLRSFWNHLTDKEKTIS